MAAFQGRLAGFREGETAMKLLLLLPLLIGGCVTLRLSYEQDGKSVALEIDGYRK